MLLDSTERSDPRYPLLQKVERQTFRASRIVNSLLELARNKQVEAVPVDLAELKVRVAQIVLQRVIRGIQRERPAIRVQRALHFSAALQHGAQQVVQGSARLQRDGLPQARFGFFEKAVLREQEAEILPIHDLGAVQLDRAPHEREALLTAAGLAQAEPEKVSGLGVARVVIQRLAVQVLSDLVPPTLQVS